MPGARITHDTFDESILIDQKRRGYLITELYGPSREVNADHWRVKKNEEEDEEEEEDDGGVGGDNYFGSESYSGDVCAHAHHTRARGHTRTSVRACTRACAHTRA